MRLRTPSVEFHNRTVAAPAPIAGVQSRTVAPQRRIVAVPRRIVAVPRRIVAAPRRIVAAPRLIVAAPRRIVAAGTRRFPPIFEEVAILTNERVVVRVADD